MDNQQNGQKLDINDWEPYLRQCSSIDANGCFSKIGLLKALRSLCQKSIIFSQPSIYIDGWLYGMHEDDVCRL